MVEFNRLHESNRYNDHAFPFGIYTVNQEGIFPLGRGLRDLHWHEELQFTLVTSGRLTIRISNHTYDLNAGEAIFINRGLLHMTTYLSTDGEYVSFNFPEKILGFFAGSRMEQDYVLPYISDCSLSVVFFKEDVPWQQEVIKNLKEIKHWEETGACFAKEYRIAVKISEIWLTMIDNISQDSLAPQQSWVKKQNRIRIIIEYIHNHYAEDIKLDHIAESAHISAGECGRCFKSMLSITPYEYLLNYRINRSVELLNDTDHTVTEIATLVGFNHPSYYIQYFKKKMGVTPKQYRDNEVEGYVKAVGKAWEL
ncbi:MAG: helix-turn-helix transcriptional regulator [Clostridia bacterium]|nr:helix-turn-helix transcriptional regulator [Clostridia bacterium]